MVTLIFWLCILGAIFFGFKFFALLVGWNWDTGTWSIENAIGGWLFVLFAWLGWHALVWVFWQLHALGAAS